MPEDRWEIRQRQASLEARLLLVAQMLDRAVAELNAAVSEIKDERPSKEGDRRGGHDPVA